MRKAKIITLLMMIHLFVPLIPLSTANSYKLGISDGITPTILIYEYTEVNVKVLESLSQEAGDVYSNLATIEQGSQYKLTVDDIVEKEDYWIILLCWYSGESLNELDFNMKTLIYKDPERLVNEAYDVSKNSSIFNFLPKNTENYLKVMNQSIPDEINTDLGYQISIGLNCIILDSTLWGYSEIFTYEYNEEVILEVFTIYSYSDIALQKELINYYNDPTSIIVLVVISISITGLFSISAYIIIRKKHKKSPLQIAHKRIKNLVNEVLKI